MKRAMISFLAVTLIVFGAVSPCMAAAPISVVGLSSSSEGIQVYYRTDVEHDSASVEIAGEKTTLGPANYIQDENDELGILFLIDSSKTVSKESQAEIKTIVEKATENRNVNSRFAVMSFGNEVSLLQDFTNARYKLIDALSAIKYSDKKACLYDGIASAVQHINAAEGLPVLSQIIVITGTTTDNSSETSYDDLTSLFKKNAHPVSIVLAENKSKGNALKSLDVFAVASGGVFIEDTAGASVDIDKELCAFINNTSVLNIPATAFPANFEGKIILSLLDRDSIVAQAELDINFDGVAANAEEPSAAPTVVQEAVTEQTKEATGSWLTERHIYLIGGIAVIMAAIIIVVSIAIKRKKKHRAALQRASNQEKAAATHVSGLLVELAGIGNESYSFIMQDSGKASIGRNISENEIVITDDRKVSGTHCMFRYSDGKLLLSDAGSTNGTFVNGQRISGEKVISNGDTIAIGKHFFKAAQKPV